MLLSQTLVLAFMTLTSLASTSTPPFERRSPNAAAAAYENYAREAEAYENFAREAEADAEADESNALYARDADADFYDSLQARSVRRVNPFRRPASPVITTKSLRCDPSIAAACVHPRSCSTGSYVYMGVYPASDGPKCNMVCECH